MQSEALQVVVSDAFGFVTDQRALPNCAPADPVPFNVLVTTESNTLSHSGAALVENNETLDWLEHQSSSVFESPPHAPSVSQRNLTPLRI